MSISFRQHVWGSVTGVALVAATLLVLSGVAEAQGTGSVVNDTRGANQNIGVTVPVGTSEGASRLVAKPGDSLWQIAWDRLQPDATPERSGHETERIFELNRNLLGSNPERLLSGQELLPSPVVNPAADVEPTTSPEPGAAEPVAATVEHLPALNNVEQRWLLGLGILVLTFVVAILMVWKLAIRRPQSWKTPVEDTYCSALPSGSEFTSAQPGRHTDNLNSNGSSAASKPKLQGRTVTPTTCEYQSRKRKQSRNPRRIGKLRMLRTTSARRPLRQGVALSGMYNTEVRRSVRHAVKTKGQSVAT